MWEYEYAAETTASAEAVWKVLSDLDTWSTWDTSMDWVRLDGPFAVGSTVSMKPTGQEPIASVITDIVDNRRYADETQFEGVTLRFSHTLEPLAAGGCRVVHRLEIAGAAAGELGPQLGPLITADFPDAMAALLARATE